MRNKLLIGILSMALMMPTATAATPEEFLVKICNTFSTAANDIAINYMYYGGSAETHLQYLREVVYKRAPQLKMFDPGMEKIVTVFFSNLDLVDDPETYNERRNVALGFAMATMNSCIDEQAYGWLTEPKPPGSTPKNNETPQYF